jgi:hypothetical protein
LCRNDAAIRARETARLRLDSDGDGQRALPHIQPPEIVHETEGARLWVEARTKITR